MGPAPSIAARFGAGWGVVLGVAALAAGGSARAQAAGDCFPACRSGYVCEAGACKPVAGPAPTHPAEAPKPPPEEESDDGAIDVTAFEGCQVKVDGGLAGSSEGNKPLHVVLGRGNHTVTAIFANGGDDTQRLLVQSGRTTKVFFAEPSSRIAARFRRGVHVGFAVEPLVVGLIPDPNRSYAFYYSARVGFLFHVGLAPAADLRVIPLVGFAMYHLGVNTWWAGTSWSEPNDFHVSAALSVEVALHASSVFSQVLGFEVGLFGGDDGQGNQFTIPRLVGKASLMSFQMGPTRAHQLELLAEAGVLFTNFIPADFGNSFFTAGVQLRYSFLFL